MRPPLISLGFLWYCDQNMLDQSGGQSGVFVPLSSLLMALSPSCRIAAEIVRVEDRAHAAQ